MKQLPRHCVAARPKSSRRALRPMETPVHCATRVDKGYNLRLCWQYPVGQY